MDDETRVNGQVVRSDGTVDEPIPMHERRYYLTLQQIEDLYRPPPGTAIFAIGCMSIALIVGIIIGFIAKGIIG